MTNYPNDPNQPGGYGQQQPDDGSDNSQSGTPPQYGQAGQPNAGQPYPGQQPYTPPQYGTPQPGNPYGEQSVAPREHQRATLIMILGILSIPCCGLFTGIPAIIMGRMALQEIDASGGAIGGRSKVNAGFICGIIGTAWTIIAAIVRISSS